MGLLQKLQRLFVETTKKEEKKLIVKNWMGLSQKL